MKVLFDNTKQRIPVKLWSEDIEEGALKQAINLSNLPFAFKHIAIMPDCHQGYGMPIGGVLAAQRVVIPYAVGFDIGCGMCAVKSGMKDLSIKQLKKIMGGIRKAVPVGNGKGGSHREKQDEKLMPGSAMEIDNATVICKEYNSALKQIGTLGGGNHFIEIQKDQEGYIWVMIHSGSRNIGYKVAKHYNDVAKELNKKWHVSVPREHDLAFLPLDSAEGQMYLKEMNYCLEFAQKSREAMINAVTRVMWENISLLTFEEPINIHHNYAVMENHFGTNVMIHRKGATRARNGEIGIIPGSQGTKSYIVKGRGNVESFMSCSHGAGRKMSRTKARETLSLEGEVKLLESQGIVHSIRGKSDLDEAAGSYKDINVVMMNQKDLVEVLVTLQPLGVIKG